jgi:hypothetical protein
MTALAGVTSTHAIHTTSHQAVLHQAVCLTKISHLFSAQGDKPDEQENTGKRSMVLHGTVLFGNYETKNLRTQADSLSPLHATAFAQSISYLIKTNNMRIVNCLRELSHFADVASGGSQTTTMIAMPVAKAGLFEFTTRNQRPVSGDNLDESR